MSASPLKTLPTGGGESPLGAERPGASTPPPDSGGRSPHTRDPGAASRGESPVRRATPPSPLKETGTDVESWWGEAAGGGKDPRQQQQHPWWGLVTSSRRVVVLCACLALQLLLAPTLLLLISPASLFAAPAADDLGPVFELMQGWEIQYSLHTPRFPENSTVGMRVAIVQSPVGQLPDPPHLVDCWKEGRRNELWDSRGPRGEDPPWAHGDDPRPPWIVGSDEDNLPGTREMQTRIWRNQFPASCSIPGNISGALLASQRFLVVGWPDKNHYGLGTQLNVATNALLAALVSNRTLVFSPGSFARSSHKGCQAVGEYGNLACYFLPITSPRCRAAAWQARGALTRGAQEQFHFLHAQDFQGELRKISASPEPINTFNWFPTQIPFSPPPEWGVPWANWTGNLTFVNGTSVPMRDEYLPLRWWKAQATRFLLRAPSPYHCHLINCVRHTAYGTLVAKAVLSGGGALPSQPITSSEQEVLAPESLRDAGGDKDHWNVFLPRPILSMHVRQGDKGREMKLITFREFMDVAERLREKVANERWGCGVNVFLLSILGQGCPVEGDGYPGTLVPQKKRFQLHNVWLTTEMQPVVEESEQFSKWQFFFSKNYRQGGSEEMKLLDAVGGVEFQTGISFANLWISSTCDYFLGTQRSGWSNAIDMYRLTAGRLRSPSLTFNFFEM